MSSMPGPSHPDQRAAGAKREAEDPPANEVAGDRTRYVDALAFSAQPVGWLAAVRHGGGIVLTVFGEPFARVTPLGDDEDFAQAIADLEVTA